MKRMREEDLQASQNDLEEEIMAIYHREAVAFIGPEQAASSLSSGHSSNIGLGGGLHSWV